MRRALNAVSVLDRSYANIKPAVNQVEHHPHCQPGTGRDTTALRRLCAEHAVVLEACASVLLFLCLSTCIFWTSTHALSGATQIRRSRH